MKPLSLNTGERLLVAALLVHAALLADLWIDAQRPIVLVNESPSLPRGLYVRDEDAAVSRGTVVALRQPAAARAYLKRWGMPADTLLIKRVAAVSGDAVCAADGMLQAPERTVAVRARDLAGLPLPHWTGCRRLGPGEVFLLGDTPTSFDGRYFGPLRTGQLTGVYKETLTW